MIELLCKLANDSGFIQLAGLSILDLVSIDNDVLSLQNVFKSWLHDLGTDSEHLHLLLPPVRTTSDGGGVKEHSLTLKCDLQERILDPGAVSPLGQHFVSLCCCRFATGKVLFIHECLKK